MADIVFSLQQFAAYFGLAIVLTFVFVMIYMQATAHDEIKLMREGNAAASLALGGALIGFALPLCTVITVSHTLSDTAIWGGIALLVQVAGHWLARLLIPTLVTDITAGKFSAAIMQAAIALTLGLLQAASWTP